MSSRDQPVARVMALMRLRAPLISATGIQHAIAQTFGANSLRAEDEPGDQGLIANDVIRARAAAFERPSVNQPCDRLVEFKFQSVPCKRSSFYHAAGAPRIQVCT